MAVLKYFGNDYEWHELFSTKLDKSANLSDVVDKGEAIKNLELDNRYIRKEVAKYGSEPNSIHHSMLIQDVTARLVSDRQINYWNSKMEKPVSGVANFSGNGNETRVSHGLGSKPSYCSITVNNNPDGRLGETWMRWDATNIIVGNTGSYTGNFTWTAFN